MKGLAMGFFLICTIIYKDFDICQSKSYYAFTEYKVVIYTHLYIKILFSAVIIWD